MSEYGEVKLEYALRGEAWLHISHFDEMRGDYNNRPKDLLCSECNSAVIPVLPPSCEIADHYRHLSESNCLLGGESALHFNAKVSLAQEMSKFRRASLVYQCRACRNWYPFLEIGPYDRVEPEKKVSARRPDVTCWDGASVVGIAEIVHSHAVDFKKKNDLNAVGCPWFEIPAISVHRQFFKFIEAANVFSIDATGAGITYPSTPKVCEVCAPMEALRAKNWRALEGQPIRYSPGCNGADFDEWRKMAERRRAGVLEEWKRWKAEPLPHPYHEDLMLGLRLEAAGITPEVDQWGLKPSTPGLDSCTYSAIVNRRKERWLAQNSKSKRMVIEEE